MYNCVYVHTTGQKVLNSKMFYLKKSFLITKPAFMWSKIQQKQYNSEIILLFKITVFYLKIKLKLLQSQDPSEIILMFRFASKKNIYYYYYEMSPDYQSS